MCPGSNGGPGGSAVSYERGIPVYMAVVLVRIPEGELVGLALKVQGCLARKKLLTS